MVESEVVGVWLVYVLSHVDRHGLAMLNNSLCVRVCGSCHMVSSKCVCVSDNVPLNEIRLPCAS